VHSFDDAIKLHKQGHIEEAEQVYRQILGTEPNHPGALHLLGVIRQHQGRHDEALDLIGRAIAVNPAKAVYHNNYGAASLSLERFDEAEASFHRALAIRPSYADALANLGMVQAALKKEEAVLETLRKALQFDPQHRDARRRLVALLVDLARHEEAVLLLKQSLANHPTAETYADLGCLLLPLGRTSEAAAALSPLATGGCPVGAAALWREQFLLRHLFL
jgi:tetratricopeptide (TPR) repeat protein